MATNALDSIRFIEIYKDSRHKNLLIEDKVYNLLNDITTNAKNIDIDLNVFSCLNLLCNGMYYNDENNTLIIDYSDALQDCRFLAKLINWLNLINPNYFIYKDLQYICHYEDEDLLIENICNYILFNDWWEDFVKLRKELEELYNKLLLKQ